MITKLCPALMTRVSLFVESSKSLLVQVRFVGGASLPDWSGSVMPASFRRNSWASVRAVFFSSWNWRAICCDYTWWEMKSSIGTGTSIETGTSIGTGASIGTGTSIGTDTSRSMRKTCNGYINKKQTHYSLPWSISRDWLRHLRKPQEMETDSALGSEFVVTRRPFSLW